MAITAAIFEFLVIGSLWSGLAVLVVVLVAAHTGLPLTIPVSFELVAVACVPFVYILGVVAQAATWKFWYLPTFHLPALSRELVGRRGEAYQTVYKQVRELGYPLFNSLSGATPNLETGIELGRLLDFLRVLCLRERHAGLDRQYQVQFHLYRLLYGSIPAALMFTLVLAVRLIVLSSADPGGYCLLLAGLGFLVSLLVTCLLFPAAAHRRNRMWKYLLLGSDMVLGPSAKPQPGK